ncbi:MAG: anthranilate phosphoribosyltransferase [Ignavibacteria bacterium RIFOXYB2_FULL_35_12]|nr:MAG: anthranilate phosphoribosyltransferase [Ignavibacteria bacterium GWC2_35_8]OGU56193.1 MAG: anthranilate phosphoribosyltransferase [Ignavibacteria bacterium GWF2_35_20]OGU83389.1 MAG: anthranilate phosphoribosyltransferase [Ignavibacteria bacterium RIFOXYA2_FULL_35_9]OGU86705.1 MAG: anthranilate phosphoribosyltransferase [Ignavibacteria bacterium RIFOXYC12_FULL_35_11]OGU89400.1 MAG: anthranilate phosphoribosyltransferase [Ignavibacteria bacterium RIFOXYA12_FULL_35_25]OGU94092.1 MAG: ant
MKEYLEKIIAGEDLTFEESYAAMTKIMNGNVNNSHLAAFLIALKSKGETAEEIAGSVQAMRDKSIKINCSDNNVIDVCGTGGDNSGSFNISTATAFAAAGAGVKVAKHGNRSISSKCGSADVLQELGINVNLLPEQSEEALNTIGIAFLFAPLYHPAMKYAAPVRKELGIKTVFNMLGPLTNPAGVKRQIIGTFSSSAAKTMSEAAKYLDLEKVCFLCSNDKYDEINLGDSTTIYEYNKGSKVKNYVISNATFNYPLVDESQIKGDTSEINAKLIFDVFENKTRNGAFHTIAANTALALYCAGKSDNLDECTEIAEESILSGAALRKLNELKAYSNK